MDKSAALKAAAAVVAILILSGLAYLALRGKTVRAQLLEVKLAAVNKQLQRMQEDTAPEKHKRKKFLLF